MDILLSFRPESFVASGAAVDFINPSAGVPEPAPGLLEDLPSTLDGLQMSYDEAIDARYLATPENTSSSRRFARTHLDPF